MKKLLITLILVVVSVSLMACSENKPRTKAVFMLLDTSGTYTQELQKAQKIVNYLLGNLDSGDSLAVARIDSGSFSEKDIVTKVTFDPKPSVTNEQKRRFKRRMDDFISTVKSSPYTDISGGVLQASEYLNETGAGHRYILIFSDLEEELIKGHIRNFDIPLVDTTVVALNVTKLRSDNVDPRDYLNRLDAWAARVSKGGGTWKVVNDLERLDKLLTTG
ncbi:MAG: VWA domain-containing protein [Gammaproteobacteria bacterium]|nr:VWA domain-containing protein [Gammaproteobacteria bacterium]